MLSALNPEPAGAVEPWDLNRNRGLAAWSGLRHLGGE